jgi:hypothetical protein
LSIEKKIFFTNPDSPFMEVLVQPLPPVRVMVEVLLQEGGEMFKRLGENRLSKRAWIIIIGTPFLLILALLILSLIIRWSK